MSPAANRYPAPQATNSQRQQAVEQREDGQTDQCPAHREHQSLSLWGRIFLAQFAPLEFHQFSQVIQQLRVLLSQKVDQKRKRQSPSRTRIQQLTQGMPCRLALKFFAA